MEKEGEGQVEGVKDTVAQPEPEREGDRLVDTLGESLRL